MQTPRYPSLYQINTRVWLTSQRFGRAATLDDIPDAELDRLAALGFDWIWCAYGPTRFDVMDAQAEDERPTLQSAVVTINMGPTARGVDAPARPLGPGARGDGPITYVSHDAPPF